MDILELEQRVLPSFFSGFTGTVQVVQTDDVTVYAAGKGGGPQVVAVSKEGVSSFYAFPSQFTGGVHISLSDDRIIATPIVGGGPQVNVFDLRGNIISSFFAWPANYTKGIFSAVSDVNGDGYNEVVVGANSELKVFSMSGALLQDTFPGKLSQEAVDLIANALHQENGNKYLHWLEENNIFNYNVQDIPLLKLAVREQKLLPKFLINSLVNAGYKLVLVEGYGATIHPALAKLRGVKVYNGSLETYDDAVGIEHLGFAVVTMNRYYDSASISPILHEEGHLIDRILNMSSRPEWQRIWKSVAWNNEVYQNYSYEAWAESFAKFWSKKPLDPAINAYFSSIAW